MKSVINSEQIKKLVIEAVEKALNECAFQHEANGKPYEGFDYLNLNENGLPSSMGMVEPSVEMKTFSETSPTQLKLTLEFYFDEATHMNKHGKLFCQPVINLMNLK